MKNTELPTLPNGLPLYKLMQYKVTKEQCQIIKTNKAVFDNNVESETFGQLLKPFSLDVKITRILQGIKYAVIETVSEDDLIVWNEKMTPDHEVTYITRKRQARTVYYEQTIN